MTLHCFNILFKSIIPISALVIGLNEFFNKLTLLMNTTIKEIL
jgi:hypothetical protein